MAQLGLPASGNTAPSAGTWFDTTTNKQFWSGPYSMPTGGGIVTDLYVYCGGDGTTPTARLVIWGSSGAILWQSGNITLPASAGWQHVSVPSVYVAAGNIYLGFWCAGDASWSFESSGGVQGKSGLASPGTATGGGDEYSGGGEGSLGAYITYTPGTVYADNGSAFVAGALPYGDDGSAWHQSQMWSDDGSAWHQIA